MEGQQDDFMQNLESELGRAARENIGRKPTAEKKGGGGTGYKGQRSQRRLGSRELKWEGR